MRSGRQHPTCVRQPTRRKPHPGRRDQRRRFRRGDASRTARRQFSSANRPFPRALVGDRHPTDYQLGPAVRAADLGPRTNGFALRGDATRDLPRRSARADGRRSGRAARPHGQTSSADHRRGHRSRTDRHLADRRQRLRRRGLRRRPSGLRLPANLRFPPERLRCRALSPESNCSQPIQRSSSRRCRCN